MATIVNDRDVLLQTSLERIISDNILYREEKATWVLKYANILGEKSSIDNLADKYGMTTEKTTYDNAIAALTSYLATLTNPVSWDNYDNYTLLSTDSTGGTVFRGKFSDVDNAKFAINNNEALQPPPADGQRGSQTLYIFGNVWSDAAADAATTGDNVLGDTVTISNGTNFVMVKYWNGSAWVPPGVVIDGNLIVTGSVTASKINSNGLTIRDTSGNVILGTGFSLDWTKLVASGEIGTNVIKNSSITIGSNGLLNNAGGGQVTIGGLGYTGDLNATYGASIGGTLSGTFGVSQVAAYFAANSIGSTYIQDLAANKILAGTLAAGVIYTGSLSANQITTGTLSANFISGGTISGTQIDIASGWFRVQSSGNANAGRLTGANLIYDNAANPSEPAVKGSASSFAISGADGIQGNSASSSAYGGSFSNSNSSGTALKASAPSTGQTAILVNGRITTTALGSGNGTITTNDVVPLTNNTYSLGFSVSGSWANIYTVNAVTVTSDIRKKTDIRDSDLGLNFLETLRPVSYKLISGGVDVEETGNILENGNLETVLIDRPGTRTHYGLIAQEVREALGSDAYAMWALDDANDPDSGQGLRYSELIGPMIKAIQELSTRVKELESR